MWKIWAWPGVFDELRKRPHAEIEEVHRTIGLLLVDPYDPPGLIWYPLRGHTDRDLLVAELALGWYCTYKPCPGGIPPMGGHFVWIRSLDPIPLAADPGTTQT